MSEKAVLEQKLAQTMSKRSKDITSAIAHIEQTGQMLDDYIVPTRKLNFTNNGKVKLEFLGQEVGLHDNAIRHIAGRMDVNAKDLIREARGSKWEREVFTNRLNEYARNIPNKNTLVRVVDGMAKGVLSDRYRRLNTSAIFMQFLMAAQDAGSVLVDANHGELKDFLEVIHPEIVEIPTNKNGMIYTVFGAQIRNSDFGASKLELKMYQMNVVCLNGMVSKSMISDVHLGSRIEESGHISFTEETMNADTQARALAVRDIMKGMYSPENIKRERAKIEEATELEIDIIQEVKHLPKVGMHQGEIELLNKTLMESNPETGVVGKNTLWKLAQGMTHVANQQNGERKRELQDIASTMLNSRVK